MLACLQKNSIYLLKGIFHSHHEYYSLTIPILPSLFSHGLSLSLSPLCHDIAISLAACQLLEVHGFDRFRVHLDCHALLWTGQVSMIFYRTLFTKGNYTRNIIYISIVDFELMLLGCLNSIYALPDIIYPNL